MLETSRSIPLRARGLKGKISDRIAAEVEELPFGARVRRAVPWFLAGLVLSVVFLPIPLIHFVGAFAGAALAYVGLRRLLVPTVVRAVHGVCPACEREQSFPMGGRPPFRLPLATSCPQCAMALTLDRPAADTL